LISSPWFEIPSKGGMRKYIPVLILLLALTARLIPGPRVIDDAYITFRYARNLIEGQGLVYNPGERVLGTTTPLFSLIMAGFGIVGGEQTPYPWLALVVSAAADCLTCLLLLHLGRITSFEKAGLAAAFIWAIHPYAVTFAIGGMETSLFVFLLMASGTAHAEKRRIPAALCASLAFITRPDAAILIGFLVLDRLGYSPPQRRMACLHGMAGIAFAGRWLVRLCLVVLRLSSTAFHHGQNGRLPAGRKRRLHPPGATLCATVHGQPADRSHRDRAGTGVLPGVFHAGCPAIPQKAARRLALVLYPWVYLVVFSLPNPLIFRWYLTPPLPMLMLVILIGIERIINGLAFLQKSPASQKLVSIVCLFLPPVLFHCQRVGGRSRSR
jgi:hypothetical protein